MNRPTDGEKVQSYNTGAFVKVNESPPEKTSGTTLLALEGKTGSRPENRAHPKRNNNTKQHDRGLRTIMEDSTTLIPLAQKRYTYSPSAAPAMKK